MLRETEKLMMESYNIKPHVFELYKKALSDVEEQCKIYDEIIFIISVFTACYL